jgi:hypothetical protein
MASGRNVINQSIRLEGGDEILRQFRSLGEEGERSARKLEQAFGRVNIGNNFAAQFGRLRTSFADLRTAGGRVATSFAGLTRGLSDVGSAFASTSARVTIFAAAVTGAAFAAGAFIRNSLNRVDDLGDLASSLGVTVTQLQTFQAAATASGIDSGTLSRGFISIGEALKELQGTTAKATSGNVRFSSSMDEAGSSTVKVISGFSNYGQVVRQGAGETAKLSESARTLSRILKNVGLKPGQEILPVDAFRAVATQFASMEDGAQKTQLSVELFGKRIGPKLIPFLNLGAKGIEKYQKQIEALGLTATNEATSIAGRAADELAFVGFLFEQYANKFATLVAPAIIQATDAILNALATNSDRISAVLQQLASSLSSIIVDLVSILSQAPDDSVSNKWLLDLRDAALAVRDTFVNVLIPAFQVIRDQAGLVASAFNTLFGTALTGDQLLVGATILKLLGIFRLLFAVVKVGAQSFMLFVNALRLIGPVGTVLSRLFPVIASGIGTVLRMLPMLAAFFSPQGLIAVGVIALGALIYGFWDEIVAGASAALSGLTTIFSDIWDGLTLIAETALGGLVTVVSDVWTGLTTASQTAWTGLTTAWRDVWIGVTTVVSDARSALIMVVTGVWAGITETVSLARDGLFAAASQTWAAITEAATAVAATIQPIWDGIVSGATTVLPGLADLVLQAWSGATQAVVASAEAIRAAIARAAQIAGDIESAAAVAAALVQPFVETSAQIEQIMQGIRAIAEAGFAGVAEAVGRAAASIERAIAAILASIRRAIAEAARLRAQGSGGSDGDGFARGGYVSGPGTSTSDSIPAYLSRGEFVVRAAAVRQYGVDFLRAINGLRMNPSRMNNVPKFALGGLVEGFNRSMLPPRPILAPAIPTAGRSSLPGKSFDLVIGNERFADLFAPDETAERLVRFATARRTKTLGRKPGWYGA